MSRKKLAWANKEVETFVCILGEEDVVYDVYVAAAAIDIRPTTKARAAHYHPNLRGYANSRIDIKRSLQLPQKYGEKTLPLFRFNIACHVTNLLGLDLFMSVRS
ncbi:unnamed protein product [Boreogadus saida]